MTTGRLLGAMLLLAMTVPAHAVDNATFGCESKSSAAAGKWGSTRGGCLSKCRAAELKGDTSRICQPGAGFPDPTTAACIAPDDAKYLAAALKACPAGSFPTCGAYGASGDPSTYVADQIASLSSLIDGGVVPFIICDTDPALGKCQFGTSKNLAKLSGSILKCLTSCYAAAQLKGDTSRQCTPSTGPSPYDALDAVTKACVQGGIDKTKATIQKGCPVFPACGLYLLGIDGVLSIVTANVAGSYSSPATNPFCTP